MSLMEFSVSRLISYLELLWFYPKKYIPWKREYFCKYFILPEMFAELHSSQNQRIRDATITPDDEEAASPSKHSAASTLRPAPRRNTNLGREQLSPTLYKKASAISSIESPYDQDSAAWSPNQDPHRSRLSLPRLIASKATLWKTGRRRNRPTEGERADRHKETAGENEEWHGMTQRLMRLDR